MRHGSGACHARHWRSPDSGGPGMSGWGRGMIISTSSAGTRVRAGLRGALEALDRDAAAWGVSAKVARSIFALPLVVALVVAASIPWREAFLFFVEEDHLLEWLQVAMVLGIAGCAAVIAVLLFGMGLRTLGLVYMLGVVAAVFIAGEEISWGQRIFGWATPEELAALNRQGETNIHNIGNVLRAFNLVMLIISAVAVVLPVARIRRVGYRPMSVEEMALIPPLFVASGFALAFAYRAVRFTLIPEGRFVVTHFQEVTEAAFYGSILVFLFLVVRRLREMRRSTVGALTTGEA